MTSTRDRILDTAEVCFAQRGFDGTSLREITRLADVNLGAVNYHFGSKSALFADVLHRRLKPMNEQRLHLLERAVTRHAPEPPPIEELLFAYLRPPIEAFDSPARGTLLGLAHRVHEGNLDPQLMHDLFAEVHERFTVIRDGLDSMTDLEYQGRMRFIVGGMIHLLADRMWTGADLNTDIVTRMLVDWACSTLRAPVLLLESEPGASPQ